MSNSCLSYDDVLLIPQYSTIRSRSEIDLTTDLGKGLKLRLPVISSPMDTISETQMAIAIASQGGVAVVHRYNTIAQQSRIISMTKDLSVEEPLQVGAAIGISGDYLERAQVLVATGVDFLCVDVAHGHHILMKEALEALRHEVGDNFHLMAGNVATLSGINSLADWGANSVRCNIGGGSICSTRIQTGHGIPGLQTIIECAKTDRNVKIIADGGIRNSGDIVKALAAGADAVMCGSLIAGTTETPGKIIRDKDSRRWKLYRGMASKEAQIEWKGKYASFEGISSTVPFRGPVSDVLEDLEKGIRSGFSYSGARTMREFQAKAQFLMQTSAGFSESSTHITRRDW